MADGQPGLRHPTLEGCKYGGKVVEIGLDAPGMPLQPVWQVPMGQALATPLLAKDDKAAIEEVSNDLEILLDRFGAAGGKD